MLLPVSLVGSLFDKLGHMKDHFNSGSDPDSHFHSSLMLLADKYAKSASVRASAPPEYSSYGYYLSYGSSPDQDILQILERMIRNDASSACAIVFSRYLAEYDSNRIEESLTRVVPSVIQWLTEHDRRPVGGYATVYRAIFVHWVDKIMGARPSLDATAILLQKAKNQWTCDCKSCVPVREFFFDEKTHSETFGRFGAAEIGYVRKRLHSMGLGHALALTEIKTKTPYGLKVSQSYLRLCHLSLTHLIFPLLRPRNSRHSGPLRNGRCAKNKPYHGSSGIPKSPCWTRGVYWRTMRLGFSLPSG